MLNANVVIRTNAVQELGSVFINDREVMTDSLTVSETVGKDRSKALRDICQLTKEIEDFGVLGNLE